MEAPQEGLKSRRTWYYDGTPISVLQLQIRRWRETARLRRSCSINRSTNRRTWKGADLEGDAMLPYPHEDAERVFQHPTILISNRLETTQRRSHHQEI